MVCVGTSSRGLRGGVKCRSTLYETEWLVGGYDSSCCENYLACGVVFRREGMCRKRLGKKQSALLKILECR